MTLCAAEKKRSCEVIVLTLEFHLLAAQQTLMDQCILAVIPHVGHTCSDPVHTEM